MFVVALARPPAPSPTPAPLPGVTATPTATAAAATRDPSVPAACAGDVRGRSFSRGTLTERATELRQWARTNSGATASLVLTDAVLTESVREQLSGPDAPPFEDAAVAIRPTGIHVSGTVSQLFFRFPISATLVPQISGGVLRFDVRDLETGNLPSGYREQVQELIREASDPSIWRLPLSVDGLALRSGCAVLTGRT